MEEFNINPLSARLMRRLAEEFPGPFLERALSYFESDQESMAHRYLAVILLRTEGIIDQLTNPALSSLPRAVMVFRRLLAVDPMLDMNLAREIKDSSRTKQAEALDPARAVRALDILHQTSPGRRLVPVLMHVANGSEVDSRIAAKATLFVGHVLQNPDWVRRQLNSQENPRVRANAVESIWGLDTSAARTLFEDWAHDGCNRVAGNALMALHIAGTAGIQDEVKKMALSPKSGFRSTAAWSLGRIGDPACVPSLKSLVRDDDPQVRSAALRSLIFIRGPR
jgi:HEAT repeat protein